MAGQIEVTRRRLKAEHVVGEDTVQATVVSDITFPVRARKVADADASVRVTDTRIIDDKIIVEGTLHKQVYWVAAETDTVGGILYQEDAVYEMGVDEPFSQFVDIPGARPGMNVDVQVRVEYLAHDPLADNNWRQTVVLEVFVKVTETVQLEVVTDVKAPGMELKVVKEKLRVQTVVGEDSEQVSLVGDITFPRQVRKIKDATARVMDVASEIIPGKVMIEGSLHKQIFYVEEPTGAVYELSHDEPFRVFVEIPGAEPNMHVQVRVQVETVEHDLLGDTSARQTAVLQVTAKVTQETELEIVTEVQGPGIEVDKELIKVANVVGEATRQVNLKQSVTFDRPVKKIADVDTRVEINRSKTEILTDKIMVEGTVVKQVYYVGLCDDAVYEESLTEPFTVFVEVAGARKRMSLDITGRVENVDFRGPTYPENICAIFAGEVPGEEFNPELFPWQQVAILAVRVVVTESRQLRVVTDVRVAGAAPTPPAPEPSLRYYVIQRGDTLWKIAQRYCTTVERLQQLNPGLDPENLQVGQKIKIPVGDPRGAK
ncbi:MAG: DUF3794 domain-containing protein [Clostridia bacterium]|nr:MAG: DUF3794 domain-containing protein [Clostridia bacterium]